MRLFISLPVPESVAHSICLVQEQIGKNLSYPLKWTDPKQYHVTVEFLGSVEKERLSILQNIITYQTNKVPYISLALDKVVAFPSIRRPQSLVVTVEQASGTYMQEFKKSLHEELVLQKFSGDFKEWRPHITLGRVKRGATALLPVADLPQPERLQWEVREAELIMSSLTSEGPVYTVLSKHSFHAH